MTWIKLDDTLPNNPKILPLSNAGFRLYIEGLCYANQYLTDGFLTQAVIRRLDHDLAHLELIEAGLWDEVEGGIQIHDYTEHQTSRADVRAKRDQSRDRVTRYREKSNADVTQPEYRIQKQNTETDIKDFDQFWESYPLRVGKGAALKAWMKAVKRATPQIIVEGACRYASDPNRDPAFTAHPATWLNSDRWTDSPLPPKSLRNGSQRLDQTPTALPPRFTADDLPQGVPMPENIRDLLQAHK